MKLSFFITLTTGYITGVQPKPSEYWKHATPQVLKQRDWIYLMRAQSNEKNPDKWEKDRLTQILNPTPLIAETNLTEWCGDPTSGQRQWFTENKCAIAAFDMTYFDTAGRYQGKPGNIRQAKQGDIIDMDCDSVICPTPKVPDCYTEPGICEGKSRRMVHLIFNLSASLITSPKANEWCMLNQQEVWIASGIEGGSSIVQQEFCAAFFNSTEWNVASVDAYFDHLANEKQLNLTFETAKDLYDSAVKRCGGNDGMAYGITWNEKFDYAKGSRGRCVKYRQENQSCVPQYASTLNLLPKMEDGKQFERPLLCDTNKNLVCTGPNFDVLPSTCVQERPRDICYFGPWWDSTICPRVETTAAGGMDYEMTLDTVRSFLLLFPGDVASPSDCEYWDVNTDLGKATLAARMDSYNIVKALWPSHLGGKFEIPGLPSFDTFETNFYLPLVSRADCDAHAATEEDGSEISYQLALAHIRAERANFIWSLVHFLMHNQPAVSTSITAVSRNIAMLLSQRFWCTNCRSYWTGVLEKYGLPPDSMNPLEHAKYWNFGHSVASEHVASIRGDDPWIYQLGQEDVVDLQNPFFISFEESVKMWTYTPNAEDGTLPSQRLQNSNASSSNNVGIRGALRSS
jgi:hypothetical protein